MSRSVHDIVAERLGADVRIESDPIVDTVGQAASLIARRDPNRYGIVVVNVSGVNITIGPDERVANGRGIKLVPGGSFSSSLREDYVLPAIAWFAAAEAADSGIFVLSIEGTGRPIDDNGQQA